MSFRSGSVQKKLKDDQFVGDLINLFERRKIKTGDPSCLEPFNSALESNDAFRSQLFTLCTAISHMSAEDLSGEQLLTLVARALGGPEVSKGDGTLDVPDGMRSSFLAGYDAWTHRSFEPKEPLQWPTVKGPESQDETQPSTAAAPAASRTPPPGIHTVQEALDIARERSLANSTRLSSQSDASIEGLTLNELKSLLAEIENRVNRLQPHLTDLGSIVRPHADELGPRDRMRAIDAGLVARQVPAPISDLPLVPRVDAPAASPAADASTQPTHRATRPASLNEAAFLARHAYLRPGRRLPPGTQTASAPGGAAATAPVPAAAQIPAPVPVAPTALPASPVLAVTPAIPAPVLTPAAPAAMPEPARVVEQPLNLSQFTRVAPIAAGPIAAVPVAPIAVPIQPPTVPTLADPAATPAGLTIVPRPEPVRFVPDEQPASLAVGRIRITRHMAIGILTAFAALIVMVSGLAGIFIYPRMHPRTINDYPDLKPQATDTAAPDASPAQILLAAPADASASGSPEPPPPVHSSSAAAKPHANAKPSPVAAPAGVWPATNLASPRQSAANSVPSLPVATIPARRDTSQAAPLYVPSATLISYAVSSTQPSYPRDQPRGINGTVVVQITVSRDGTVTDIRVVSGPVEMRPATIQAVQTWRFRPYLVDGSPVEVVTTLGFLFKGQ